MRKKSSIYLTSFLLCANILTVASVYIRFGRENMLLYFYEILQSIMKEKHLSIPAVARLSGLPDSTIRSILARKNRTVALEVAFKLAKGLDVSLEELNGEPRAALADTFPGERERARESEGAVSDRTQGAAELSTARKRLLKKVGELDEGELSAVSAFIKYLGEAKRE